jgi:organic radical activating enzyme
MIKTTAHITEIFSSLQGEGPHTGEAMTFVRFAGCSTGCRWCDSIDSIKTCINYRVETPPRSGKFVTLSNPVSLELLNEQLAYFTDDTISVTGGEPLEQVDFLAAWLPALKPAKRILLETNGIYALALEKISGLIDIISMDIKLPSSTGGKNYWQEHSAFLSKALASGKETYVKIVVTSDTSSKDIQEAIKIVASANKFLPVILQPAGISDQFNLKISDEQMQSFARLCNLWLPNVSIMTQMHKEAGLL